MFSLPNLVIGLIAIGDNLTFLSIGLVALSAGGGREYFLVGMQEGKVSANPTVHRTRAESRAGL